MSKNVKVLLAEGKNETVAAMTAAMNAKGFDVLSCEKDGAEVLRALDEYKPDVVILDAFCSMLMLSA